MPWRSVITRVSVGQAGHCMGASGGVAAYAAPTLLAERQQAGIAACRRRVDGDRLLGGEPRQVVRAASLGAGTRQVLPAERLHADHRADLVAVDVAVADLDAGRDLLDGRVDARMDAEGQAVTGVVDGVDHRVELSGFPAQ